MLDDIAAMCEEISAVVKRQRRSPGWVTAREYAEYHNISHRIARDVLEVGAESGTLLKTKAVVNGHWTNLYRRSDAEA